eukprot:Skav202649  [mRNA]  locus=scaffold2784:154857:155153:- [translate_table: standard]
MAGPCEVGERLLLRALALTNPPSTWGCGERGGATVGSGARCCHGAATAGAVATHHEGHSWKIFKFQDRSQELTLGARPAGPLQQVGRSHGFNPKVPSE